MKVFDVGRPVRESGGGNGDRGDRAINPGMQLGDWLEVRVRRQPVRQRHHSAARCAVDSLGSTGINRAARPKRKIAAANNPIDSPHSMSVGE